MPIISDLQSYGHPIVFSYLLGDVNHKHNYENWGAFISSSKAYVLCYHWARQFYPTKAFSICAFNLGGDNIAGTASTLSINPTAGNIMLLSLTAFAWDPAKYAFAIAPNSTTTVAATNPGDCRGYNGLGQPMTTYSHTSLTDGYLYDRYNAARSVNNAWPANASRTFAGVIIYL